MAFLLEIVEKHDFCLPKTNWMIRSSVCFKGLCIVKVESSSNVNLKKVIKKIQTYKGN